jgi:ATP-dependent Clp protease ATP-binding subunit ClpX
VIEEAMLNIMYEIPSKPNVKEVKIDKGSILREKEPELVLHTEAEMKRLQEEQEQESA